MFLDRRIYPSKKGRPFFADRVLCSYNLRAILVQII